ncbi:hypothetical protein TREMEDRAFT_61077 [Tremella mesenterica DSM 1558]|uniref:uncharacterized protein n=1 Tax=Tremella mesenterica (strain ATCC 24925 / CBS 8224 / DSM 1558 / NBRC 9311 / NRRL Y-6157 / RJB 2259-6 / UBC 559-6) TaxID=578456 RepID=UPI0003F4914D|nr:uncharacterized protein TREMEDRAFT_61077 [Tremella mesenterica DSM 1558]EIW70572.1 hypothetical protein TREMEDRAFT_61077 [Tremella mesenterica DSM 1558]
MDTTSKRLSTSRPPPLHLTSSSLHPHAFSPLQSTSTLSVPSHPSSSSLPISHISPYGKLPTHRYPPKYTQVPHESPTHNPNLLKAKPTSRIKSTGGRQHIGTGVKSTGISTTALNTSTSTSNPNGKKRLRDVSSTSKNKKSKRWNARLIQSILYQTSFSLFLLITGVLLVGTAYALGEQAVRRGGQKRWNVVIIVGAYFILGMIALFVIWSRWFSIRSILHTMPRPYVPTKQVDIPKKVADHIATEYSRTAIIAHISQATKGQQEGWGRPGTKWENQHFRVYILSTLPTMRQALAPESKAPDHALFPLLHAARELTDEKGAFITFVHTYVEMIEKARFARREPTESEAAACEKLVNVILLTRESTET